MNGLFELGRQGFLENSIDWDTATISAALLDLGTTDVGIKAITSSTNATPIVVTSTSHGFANGDLVFIDGHATNTAANGFWKIANQAANTFELTNPITAANAVGNGVGGATGYAVNYGPSAAGDNWDDFNGAVVGTPVNLAGKTVTAGVADANDVTFTSVTGNSVEAVAIFEDTGTASTSQMIALITGKHIVTCAVQAAASSTSIVVDPLTYAIPNSTVLAFSNGASATLSALANAGDRSIAVTSTAAIITANSRALAPATGSGLPVTPNGGNIVVTFDNGPNKIFKL